MAQDDKVGGAQGGESFASLFGAMEASGRQVARRKEPAVGDRVSGTIVSIGKDEVFVDVGAKAEGTIGREALGDSPGELGLAVGDTIEALVIAVDDESGLLILGRHLDGAAELASDLETAYQNRLPIEGLVTEARKGGVTVKVAGIDGFCPISQLDRKFVEDIEPYIGQRYVFRITRFEGGRRPNVVLSRRAILDEEARIDADLTRETLAVGAVFSGTVTAVKDYGAFVDIGGLEGMVHISEIGFARVEHPKDVLSVGQTVEVQVLRIEKTSDEKRPEKISLSLRALDRDPFEDVETHFSAGTHAVGKVMRLEPFGAFVELAPGIQGLIHISELAATRHIQHPREVLEVGQPVDVTVLSIDHERRRVALARRDPAAVEAANDPPPKPVTPETLGTFADLFNRNK